MISDDDMVLNRSDEHSSLVLPTQWASSVGTKSRRMPQARRGWEDVHPVKNYSINPIVHEILWSRNREIEMEHFPDYLQIGGRHQLEDGKNRRESRRSMGTIE